MANALYTSAKNILLGTGSTRLDLDTDAVKLVGLDTADYTYSAAHDFLDDLTSAGRVPAGTVGSAGVALTSKTITAGVFSSAPVTFTAVTGDTFEAVALFKFLTSEALSDVIAYYDTFTAGMPVTPNGGDITFSPNGTTGWLAI